MKKVFIVLQVLIVGIVIVKLMAVGQIFLNTDVEKKELFLVNKAMAQLNATGNPAEKLRDMFDDRLQKERDLYAALEKRRAELDAREKTIKDEENNLQSLKKEIVEKIDSLKALQNQMEGIMEAQKNIDAKKFKDLAKIYESAAPAKAGAMMEKLDTKTAAGITMSMKKDRAGAVLSNMNLQKAVDITKEITHISKASRESQPQ